jgi:spore coat protein CotH
VYGAQIPSQAAGQLVRFKIIATNSSGGRAASPDVDDSQRYHGYVVRDPSVTSSLPIVQWFMSDADYQDMHENHATDNLYLKSVIAYGDQVIDNTDVRIKGEFSRSFPKKGYKFKLPRGNKISMPGHLQRDVSEFHMNGEWLDESKAMTATVWQIAEEIGIDVPSIFGTRLQRNGQYEGYYLLAEKYEKEFRQDKGYDGEVYEDLAEKVQPDDGNILPAELMRDAFAAGLNILRERSLAAFSENCKTFLL